MSSIRVWHTYLGILIAPSILFFAITGALQLFGLHEAHGAYQPPPLIEKLSRLHKDQVFAQKARHEQRPEPGAGAQEHPPGPPKDEGRPPLGTLLLKGFFLLVALGLMSSTSLGLWLGLTHVRHKRLGWVLLALGVILPVAPVLL